MSEVQYSLLSDGSSDRVLLPILSWLLRENGVEVVQSQWADLRRLRNPPMRLPDRIRTAVELYPCDLLFIHRDAEREPFEVRKQEILDSVAAADIAAPAVCVVPVRMQEAWLLIEEHSTRTAAGNPIGRAPLNLPPPHHLEEVPDPKELLYRALRQASELRRRRLRDYRERERVHRVAELIEDYSLLRQLAAFRRLEQDLVAILHGEHDA